MGSLLGAGWEVEVEEAGAGVEYIELKEFEEFPLERVEGEGVRAG